MHDGNYDRNDPQCIKHKDFIEELERHRFNFEKKKDTKFYSKENEIRDALDDIYRFIRNETHYAPAWLINHLAKKLSSVGRRSTYSYDTRVFYSTFIDLLATDGCPRDQAIRLISILKGDKVMTEGFKKELRDTYREYLEHEKKDDTRDITDIAVIVSQSLTYGLSGIQSSAEKIDEGLNALRKTCDLLLQYMREHHSLIKANDSMYPQIFMPWPEIIEKEYDDPLNCFYEHAPQEPAQCWNKAQALREFFYAAEFFKEKLAT